MKNNTLNKLKSGYEELEIQPSSDLWDRLERELDEKPEIILKPSFHGWKYAAVIALLISLGSLRYFNSDSHSQTDIIKITQKTSENVLKLEGKQEKTMVANENNLENRPSFQTDKNNKRPNYSSDKENLSVRIEQPEEILLTEKKNTTTEAPVSLIEKQELNPVKPLLAERKKTSYISADDLLVGRELDKTREESYNDQRKFGVIDMSKIKIKGPNSLKILGFTVISDSVKTK
ncbi:hypothetical protein JI747_004815 [Chryseobacterium sp. RG1]|uniref:Uncharacterized protein n=1 Tax=Chryseobacterium tagetis TaxID=2801334 RepID=A0ABS7ZY62_9FLAO|nr:hypothetical protein [Chryseobacterium tagetis]MCA6066490.1 hypothetical protein [Chryseobacterium tagetis]